MKISRHNLIEQFRSFAHAGHGVVIGEPGAGKTYTLSYFARRVLAEKRACLYLPLDKLGVSNVVDLHDAIGISGDLIQYLHRQPNANESSPGFMLIDAFDAIRSEMGQRQFLNLIKQSIFELSDTWRVIV